MSVITLAARFQFTHPGRGATTLLDCMNPIECVSIHAPREGCDYELYVGRDGKPRFNSRTPGGVRPFTPGFIPSVQAFQFTHPGRGATKTCDNAITAESEFQFTHPGRGATSIPELLMALCSCFNSRTPGGVRLLSAIITKHEY